MFAGLTFNLSEAKLQPSSDHTFQLIEGLRLPKRLCLIEFALREKVGSGGVAYRLLGVR